MKVAVIGSRSTDSLSLDAVIERLPKGTYEIITGGAKGVDLLAEAAARQLQLHLKIILPNYKKYGRAAPIVRNEEIINSADFVLAFWDFHSKGTRNVILECIKKRKPVKIIKI